jgi:hypothetical protein
MDKFIVCDKIVFEIIGTADTNEKLRKLEDEVIESNRANPFLLNKDSGTKMITGFSKAHKKVKKISPDGSIEIFPSICSAAKHSGCSNGRFRYNLRMGYKTRSCIYRALDCDGNEIIPPSRVGAKGKWKSKEAA